MNRQTSKNSFMVGAVAIGVIAGLVVGFFTAHRMITGDLKQRDMKGMPMEGTMPMKDMEPVGEAGALAPARRAGEIGGMSGAPSGAVVVPAVMRQLIGVRSAPVTYASLGQEIRAVGTVGYDERGLTQVTVKTSGWVREVFV
ncbi:MAG: hypothetical protein KGO23_05070, partial [Nitrospirota bacterium]|nr:hypothetical protein [Nitrospirota bacterium]